MEEKKLEAAGCLVRQLLISIKTPPLEYTFSSTEELSDGVALFAILHATFPTSFPTQGLEAGALNTNPPADFSVSSFVEAETQRAANVEVLIFFLLKYMRDKLDGQDAALRQQHINVHAIASIGRGPAPSTESTASFVELLGIFVAAVVLSSMPNILVVLKSLPRERQVVLSNWTREMVQRFGVKPRRSSAESQQLQQKQPPLSASVSEASIPQSAASTGNSASAVGRFNTSSHGPCGYEEEEGYYRNATYQLRQELATMKEQLSFAQDAYRISKEEKETAENKYRLLLGDQTNESPGHAMMAGSSTVSSKGAEDAARLWQQRVDQKDETIAALKSHAEKQLTQISALKEMLAAQEMGLQTMKRRLKKAEEQVAICTEERREALEKLSVSDDKLTAQMKARAEMENEVEEIRGRLTVVQLELERARGASGGEEVVQMNSSFASNDSMDRVMLLQSELDEMRQQRDSLQRQVGILQRQVAAMPTPGTDMSATVNDTWRATLRQVERERDDLRQQLSSERDRTGTLQQRILVLTRRGSMLSESSDGRPPATGGAEKAVSSGSVNPSTATVPQESELEGTTKAEGVQQFPSADASGMGTATGSTTNTLPLSNLPPSSPLRTTAKREYVVLWGLLTLTNYKLIKSDQSNTLLFKDAQEAARSKLRHTRGSTSIEAAPSSQLTEMRLDIEGGLFESILHGAVVRAGYDE